MTWYAATSDCLRGYILKYFGESSPHYCGKCSNCTTVFENIDITLPAQKIISCVYRIERQGRSFGKNMVVNILRGSKSEKIKSFGLDKLSTYGIMADTDARRIRTILDYLIEKDYLTAEGDEYPVVRSSSRSGEIIFEKKSLSMMLAKEVKKDKQAAPPEAVREFDESLFVKLKDLRTRLAQEARVPSYIIFSDAALRDMCRKRPVSKELFLEVSGVGRVKMEKYGDDFTRLIQEHEADRENIL
jgi:ATP-dependent DNA helicase RecQ